MTTTVRSQDDTTDEHAFSRYARIGHKKVRGWMSCEDVRLFQELIRFQTKQKIAGHFCEIGVHHGKRFLVFFISLRPTEYAVAIDVFDQQEFNSDRSGFGDKRIFLQNLEAHAGRTDRLIILERDSASIAVDELVAAAGGKFRLFSVDGSHTAAMTASDLRLACESLALGGTIILDDYYNEMWPGVVEGACRTYHDGVFTARDIVPYAIFSTKVLFCHAKYAEGYRTHLATHFTEAGFRNLVLFGSPVLGFYYRSQTTIAKMRRSRFVTCLKSTPAGLWIRRLLS
jgi:hypothetical protein